MVGPKIVRPKLVRPKIVRPIMSDRNCWTKSDISNLTDQTFQIKLDRSNFSDQTCQIKIICPIPYDFISDKIVRLMRSN